MEHIVIKHNENNFYIDKCGDVELDYSLVVTVTADQETKQIRCRICGEMVDVPLPS